MAIVKPAPIISDLRGSIGGVVFTRSRAGAVARRRVKPTPSSSAPLARHKAFHSIKVDHWRRVLTNAQRLEWNTTAETVRWTNRLGDQYTPSGYQLFMRQAHNMPDSPYPLPSVPPAVLKSPLPPLVLSWYEPTDVIFFNTQTNFIPGATVGLIYWQTSCLPPSHYYVHGPWTFIGTRTITQGLPFEYWAPLLEPIIRPCRVYFRFQAALLRHTQSDPIILGISVPPWP